MKKLACEMCGSTNIVKKEGLWVCQSCGAKYSPEEAKRMMVEGTVKIDYSSKIDNHRKLLEKAIENRRWKDVKKYSDEILSFNPEDYQAIFYKELSECWISEINDFNEGYDVINAFDEVINILKNENSEELAYIIVNYSSEISFLVDSIQGTSVGIYNDRINESYHYSNGSEVREDAKVFYRNNLILCDALINKVIDYLHEYSEKIKNDEKLKKEIPDFVFVSGLLNFLKEKDFLLSEILNLNNDPQLKEIKEKNIEEIKKYDSSYVAAKNDNCYIATSVYGSYDCPEVWTLRRFRDNNLKKLWYGNLFIKIYYTFSPMVVKFFGSKKWFNRIFKSRLDGFVRKLQDKGFESSPYADR